VLDRGIRIGCQEPMSQALVTAAYGPMQGDPGVTDLDYIEGRDGAPASFFVKRAGREPLTAPDDGTFLALLDGDVAIELQKLRPDLYFIHAAVLQRSDAAVMLVAPSGGGKSTLCWALLHHGFRYLSDELGPVDLEQLNVHSYPLPPKTVRTSRTRDGRRHPWRHRPRSGPPLDRLLLDLRPRGFGAFGATAQRG
jgi:hypothetical protein